MKIQKKITYTLSMLLVGAFVILFNTAFIMPPENNGDELINCAEDNGVTVTVVKDRGWFLLACDQAILAETSTEVFLDDTRVVITNIWKLPEGHCLIPERGAAIYPNLVVTPNGTAKGQAIVHPNEL